ELTEPGITTLEQFSEEIGKTAARMLIERIAGVRNTDLNSVIAYKPRLMVRESTLKSMNNLKTA
ncbi:MAG: substrate-binding domain-containing protein, partial [Prolixibacteraceae bacterium]|nr:substrate-binding domain-containing protein [Prolixibacteraceae bacterium]